MTVGALWAPGNMLLSEDGSAFRGDVRRSAASEEKLVLPLKKIWTYLPVLPPYPAWPLPAEKNYIRNQKSLKQTLGFDVAFHVVCDESSLCFGSSADDTITALNASDGSVKWDFTTEGPVRLPPVLSNNRIFAGSDDGYLYCLDAQTGEMIWRYSAAPEEKRLPGNGRMISQWPIRCGIVEDSGVVYCTAGIFPQHGVFICAVAASDGKEIYREKLPFTAQGTMLASTNRIYIASGRTSYWSSDRVTGKDLIQHGASFLRDRNLVGGSNALLIDDLLATGPSELGEIHVFDQSSATPVLSFRGDALIVQDEFLYLLAGGTLKSYRRSEYFVDRRKTGAPVPIWSVKAGSANVMLLAGNTLITGGNGEVSAYDVMDGSNKWTSEFDGSAEGLAVAGGHLYVSLDKGDIICFGAGDSKSQQSTPVSITEVNSPYPEDPLSKCLAHAAEYIIRSSGVDAGYCLVLDAGIGQLAYEIARRSNMNIICVEKDREKIKTARSILRSTGLYGSRISFHEYNSDTLPYPEYFANLITSESMLLQGITSFPASEMLRMLRPCGGMIYLGVNEKVMADKLAQWGKSLPGWKLISDSSSVLAMTWGIAKRPALPGAGEWSHFYANTENTACSGAVMPAGPTEIQWFGRPGPRNMVDRHFKASAPLYKNGRLFVTGFNYIAALDAYNGVMLWEKKINDTVRMAAFRDCSGIVATDDSLYVAASNYCLRLDAQSGEEQLRFELDDRADGQTNNLAWGYVACVDNLLIGSTARGKGSIRSEDRISYDIVWRNQQPVVCSTAVFALDRLTGERIWEYVAQSGMIVNPSITIGSDRIYFIASNNRETFESSDGRITPPDLLGQSAQIVALDLRTGTELWSEDANLQTISQVLYMSYAEEVLVISGSRYVNVSPEETVGKEKPEQLKRIRYELFAFDALRGKSLWSTTETPVYDHVLNGEHGEQVQHPSIVGNVIYGPGFACQLKTGKPHDGWVWKKSHKCGTVSTSLNCAFSRYTDTKLPYMFDLQTGEAFALTTVTRPGCWINIIPVGGLIIIPEASAGCTCPYPIQTSLALRPR